MKLALASAFALPLAHAEEAEDPGLEFLEYLGSWQENDEEWLAIVDWEDADKDDAEQKARQERNDDETDT